MAPLTLIGVGAGAPAAGAAAVLAPGRSVLVAVAAGPDAARRVGELDAMHILTTDASPLVAARHAGMTIDPGELAAAAAGADVVALDGGVLAPLTPRFSVRDLARELDRPVVLALGATGGMTAEGRSALELLRSTGLEVRGVLLSGWPEPPTRALLDERALLAALGGVPVEPLAAAERALAAWTAAAPGREATPRVPVALEPYVAWEGEAASDPRTTPRPQLMTAMLQIAEVEGPLLALRAYALYNRAAGGRKLTAVARAPLSSAVYWLAREGKVVLTRREDAPGPEDEVIRLPDTPAVRVRELGPRNLEEVPLDEVAELVRRLRAQGRLAAGERAKRAVLDVYGLVRLTARADGYLERALALAGDEG